MIDKGNDQIGVIIREKEDYLGKIESKEMSIKKSKVTLKRMSFYKEKFIL